MLWHPFLQGRRTQVPLFTEDSIAKGIPDDTRGEYHEAINNGIKEWEKVLKEAEKEVKPIPSLTNHNSNPTNTKRKRSTKPSSSTNTLNSPSTHNKQ